MNSIESLRLDFNSQIEDLGKYVIKRFLTIAYMLDLEILMWLDLLRNISLTKCRCYSPSDLVNSSLSADKTYCFISVTGKTKANIELARRAKKSGLRTVAVTANEKSKLAQVCDQVIPLKITRVKTPTAGFRTFVANVITCLQLLGIDVPNKFDHWHKEAKQLSSKISESLILPNDMLYILGNNLLYPLALYTSFQMAEFFGTSAVAHKLEEFCHSPIFGMKKSHNLWILGQKEEWMSRSLGKLGFSTLYIELYNSDILTQLFESIFFVQNLILLLAKKHGYTELQYTVMKDVLKASSDIIYED